LEAVFVDLKQIAQEENARQAYDVEVLQVLEKPDVQLVLLAGYMRIVTPVLIRAYQWRMMNIHPFLLPAFPGLDLQKQALEWGTKISGCTVHFVTEGVDEGPIIIQASVPVLQEDTIETISARILEHEHKIYPTAVQLFAEGRIRVDERRVRVTNTEMN
jgi:phosphoribosylglycinamide formyltransferase-1